MAANILVVDDSISFAKILRDILEEQGHHVVSCYDGREVFKVLIEMKIDVILLDVIMPRLGGFDILEMLQQHELWRNIPVLMVTGIGHAESVKKGLDLGAVDYIKKPCEHIEIIARVNAAVRLKEKHDLLSEFATTDSLTQVYNRSYLDVLMRRLMEKRDQYEKGISYIMLDCDFFKNINDVYGHLRGDEVLRQVAHTISRTVKNIDTVGRYGGEEFCVVLPNTLLSEAALAAERIRANVEKLRFSFDGDDVSITASLGVAHMPRGKEMTQGELVGAADGALYQAKRSGRNRVELMPADS